MAFPMMLQIAGFFIVPLQFIFSNELAEFGKIRISLTRKIPFTEVETAGRKALLIPDTPLKI